MSRNIFARAQLALAIAAVLSLSGAWSGTAGAEDAPATFTLVGPTAGETVVIKPYGDITFRWKVGWPTAPTGTVIYKWQLATDPGFNQIASTENHACTPQQGAGCWTSFTPNRVYEPLGKTWYWRVAVAGGATSATGSFKVQLLRDTVRPRVRAMSTTLFRGRVALFTARMTDDRGEVRFRATLSRGGRTVLTGSYPFTALAWNRPYVFESRQALSRRLPAGAYSFCVQVWDHDGNTAKHCATSHVR